MERKVESFMFWDIIIVAGVFWIIMSFFSYMQNVQIRNIYKVLEGSSGKIYFGRDAGIFRTKYLTFAAVNENGKVLDARKLKASRIVTFARTSPFPELIGKDLKALRTDEITEDKNIAMSLENLVKNYRKYNKVK
ncbi:transcriptional regulator GutM [Sinanaerobacter chloroacetimidivorans]|jgi:DNA-binding transcriptional regulator of glucitol operon|uniref:Glucitol operon activator protein n=1 Tax=Sinanaerobacter chloroacetimidivorans TaxID=2818044 RepID=A0A8J7W1P5_9FIRM|nr:transcriptional regulator GutM [Sinanaerobacter chloroacetimidivorans]MBR0599232.1 hypothetical protein [Sinanaerobacter chloroacetimidivorans]